METLIDRAIPPAFALALALAVALPAAATADSVVPPENSAATQYTEAIPTGGGQKDAGKGDGGNVSPAAVLGSHKAKKLESKGREGREVAEVVVATAPSPPPAPVPEPQPAARGDNGKTQAKAKAKPDQRGANSAKRGDGQAGGQEPSAIAVRHVEIPAGSSGLGEVLAQATGSSSSGQLGALLPLLILAALAWALAFVWRQRQRPA